VAALPPAYIHVLACHHHLRLAVPLPHAHGHTINTPTTHLPLCGRDAHTHTHTCTCFSYLLVVSSAYTTTCLPSPAFCLHRHIACLPLRRPQRASLNASRRDSCQSRSVRPCDVGAGAFVPYHNARPERGRRQRHHGCTAPAWQHHAAGAETRLPSCPPAARRASPHAILYTAWFARRHHTAHLLPGYSHLTSIAVGWTSLYTTQRAWHLLARPSTFAYGYGTDLRRRRATYLLPALPLYLPHRARLW